METKINAQDLYFGEFHRKGTEIFFIPSLQRPYSWEAKKQVNRLWEDILENEEPYYIGSIVSVLGGGTAGKDQIIDGQQRLTTLYLMLTSLRNFAAAIKTKESKELVLEIENYLIKFRGRNDEGEVRLSFSNDGSNDVYKAIINNEKLDTYKSETQKRFIKNFEYISEKVADFCKKKGNKLLLATELFERIKNLQLIFIECQDKSAAFRLFESINATGISLATTDMIKNSIFESVHKDKKILEFVENGWKEINEVFNEDSSALKTYIRHHWISTVDYTSHSKLFDDFLDKYEDKESVVRYAKSLFLLAPVYNSIRKGNVETLDKLPRTRNEQNEIREVLRFLDSLGVDQIYSVLLNMYSNEPEKFRKDLIRLTAFQFIFKYIPGSPSLPEKKFANFCNGKLDKNKLMNELIAICKNKENDFVKKMTENIKYVGGNSVDIQFILEKYLYELGGSSKFATPTIEHILPQDLNDLIYSKFTINKKLVKKINSLGNLTILEKSENSSENEFNQEFSKKYPLYGKHLFKGNKKIIKYKFDESPELAIEKRGDDIAGNVYKVFFRALETGKWHE